MSGNADSKQISVPTGSGRPSRSTTGSRCTELPGARFSPAAALTPATQPSSGRSGMYSPNGTSRIFR